MTWVWIAVLMLLVLFAAWGVFALAEAAARAIEQNDIEKP